MKLLVTFLLLPLGLVLCALAALAVVAWRRRYQGGLKGVQGVATLGGLLAFLWVCSLPVTGQLLQISLAGLIHGRSLSNPAEVQAIVVLTGGINNAGPIGWLPKPESLQRLMLAYELQRAIDLRIPVIISGGYTQGVQAPSEARVLAEFFARHRSEVTPTELEEVSTDTAESAVQLAPIFNARGLRNVVLVTTDIHMPRALAAFRARGIDPIPAPAIAVPTNRGLRPWLPSAYGLLLTSEALTEYYGIFGYLLQGKIRWADLQYAPLEVQL
ncbi:MAG: YdcF family protein [Alphaproteobacteria bacterium]|nr:YdcF family protein [Alphaproteobacteria bacterium]